jgi:hypothetical protein
MKRRKFFTRLGTGTLAVCTVAPLTDNALESSAETKKSCILKKDEIQHVVIFNLKHEKESDLALRFLNDGHEILSNIKVVNDFQVFSQVSLKNDYTYGFSMVFASKTDYDAYSNHPDHVAFVEQRWKKEVTRFLEIDLSPFKI